MGFKGGDRGSGFLPALMPFALKAGLMKPRKGFIPKKKPGVDKQRNLIDKIF
jgi:hypothetical protein